MTVIVKATFGIVHDAPARLVAPIDLVREDRVRGDGQSLEAASEIAPYLPGAGVVLTGRAHAPAGRPAPALSIRLALYRERPLLDKTLHVIGYRGPKAPNQPFPFQDVPIVYERAFGGPGVEENPAGTGAAPGSPLPNIVDPADARRPAGFGPIARWWAPRKRLLGAADPTALDRPIAEVPETLDWRYLHAAPADQQIEAPLRGDEWIVLDGMHPEFPRVQSRLPSPRAEARFRLVGPGGGGPLRPIELCADTLVIDADARTASIVWRGHVLLDRLDAAAADPWSILGRMRVFAGVEMPAYPIPWPQADEVAAPAVSMSADAARARPAASFVDPPATTERIDLRKQKEPVLPFRAPVAGEVPRFEEPRPTSPALGSTAVAAISPFATGAALPFKPTSAPAPASAPAPIVESRGPGPDMEDASASATQAIDLRALAASSGRIAPFALAAPRARSDAPRAAIPGAPWAQPAAEPPSPSQPPSIGPAVPAPVPPAPVPPPAVAAPSSPWGAGTPAFVAASSSSEPPAPIAPPAFVASPEPPLAVSPEPPPIAAPPEIVAPSAGQDAAEPPEIVAPPEPPRSAAGVAPLEAPRAPSGIRDRVIAAVAANEPLDGLDLAGADLSEIDLAGRSLAGKNLRGTVLRRANLAKASLASAQLAEADLREAVLTGADLAKADLSRVTGASAVFDGAKLDGVTAEGAELAGASFAGADAEGSSWERATLTDTAWKGAKLKGASFPRAAVDRADFSGADLTEATLRRMTGEGVLLDHAKLERADLRRVTLPGASLVGANVAKATFDKADLARASLEEADLRGASLRGVVLKGASLEGALLDGADLRDADLEQANLLRTDRKNAKLGGANLKDVREDQG